MLDAFAKTLKNQGSISWNLAYHPYSSPLTEPKFWKNTNGQLTKAITTPVINMGNISILSAYIKNTYGSSTRIILSEQGFTSVQQQNNVEKAQSAAIVYSYYLTEADDMIDSFIMNRHVDNQTEINQGLNLGLWTTSSDSDTEWASEKKDSWYVFKYMDTNQSKTVSDSLLSEIGAASWADIVPDFSSSLYNKTNITTVEMSRVSGYTKAAGISNKWKRYGASVSQLKNGKTQRVVHDSTRYRNSLWGFTQTFKKKLSFKKASRFCTTLRVSGSTNGSAVVKIKFYSGNKILESSYTVKAKKTVHLSVSLAKWKYRGAVTKIQILVAPNGGAWTDTAYLDMKATVRSK